MSVAATLCVPRNESPYGTVAGGYYSGYFPSGRDPVPAGYVPLTQVTASANVQVYAPYYFFGQNEGKVFLNNACVGLGSFDGAGDLAVDDPPGTKPPGMKLTAKARTPDSFWTSGGSKSGSISFFQLVYRQAYLSIGSGRLEYTTNHAYYLDANAPYGGSAPANSGAPNSSNLELDDSPEFHFVRYTLGYAVDDRFKSYLMYIPPGKDVSWVPLAAFSWGWMAVGSYNFFTGNFEADPSRSWAWENPDFRCYDFPVWDDIWTEKP